MYTDAGQVLITVYIFPLTEFLYLERDSSINSLADSKQVPLAEIVLFCMFVIYDLSIFNVPLYFQLFLLLTLPYSLFDAT